MAEMCLVVFVGCCSSVSRIRRHVAGEGAAWAGPTTRRACQDGFEVVPA
jgi:hypothetical protein